MRVLLIGPRGAGKSSVARVLAELAGLSHLDTDALIETRTGRTIAELLADGSFREHERAVLGEALARGPAIVAAGGGAVLWGAERVSTGQTGSAWQRRALTRLETRHQRREGLALMFGQYRHNAATGEPVHLWD